MRTRRGVSGEGEKEGNVVRIKRRENMEVKGGDEEEMMRRK
jgi:hypothetical protein